MRLPTKQDLDAMAQLIGGDDKYFEDLGPEARLQIVTLCLQADVGEQLFDISADIRDMSELSQTLLDNQKAAIGHIEDIANYSSHVSRWFELSKLWEGRLS